jgi:hypothetical protein
MITSQVLQAVQDAALVVADLTGHNPNVFYELAVRHAMEKPVIHLIDRRLSKIPFDVGGFRTIEFDLTDLDSIESTVEQLAKQAEQAQSGKWGETPIKIAQIMRRTKEDSPELVLLKQTIEGISDIAGRITRLENPHAMWPSSRVVTLSDIDKIAITNSPLYGATARFSDGPTLFINGPDQTSKTLASKVTEKQPAAKPEKERTEKLHPKTNRD